MSMVRVRLAGSSLDLDGALTGASTSQMSSNMPSTRRPDCLRNRRRARSSSSGVGRLRKISQRATAHAAARKADAEAISHAFAVRWIICGGTPSGTLGLGGAQVENTAEGAGARRWKDAAAEKILAAIYS